VVIGCRSPEKGAQALREIKQASGGKVDLIPIDLASLQSIREFVRVFKEHYRRLDVLLNNAGVMLCPYATTTDGFEMQWGTNHIGPFYLTHLLLPMIIASKGRVVNTSSNGHLLLSDQKLPKTWTAKNYKPDVAYGDSKLGNVLFTLELQRRLADTGATAYSLHPGGVRTELQRHMHPLVHLGVALVGPILLKSPLEGAQTSLFCMLDSRAVPGRYHVDCKPATASSGGRDPKLAAAVWEHSARAVGVQAD